MKRKLTLDEWKAIGKNLKEFRTQQLVGNFFQTLTKNSLQVEKNYSLSNRPSITS